VTGKSQGLARLVDRLDGAKDSLATVDDEQAWMMVGGPSAATEATEGGIYYCRSDQEGATRVRDPGPGEARRHDRIRGDGDDPGVTLGTPTKDQGHIQGRREQARSALGREAQSIQKLQWADQGRR
jgi:hypothetical protein